MYLWTAAYPRWWVEAYAFEWGTPLSTEFFNGPRDVRYGPLDDGNRYGLLA
jgi:hypothetical protein